MSRSSVVECPISNECDAARPNHEGDATFWLNCPFELPTGVQSERVSEVEASFGISGPPERLDPIGPVRLALSPGRIVFVCGPSGSGKSSVLRQLARSCSRACVVNDIRFGEAAAVIDEVAPHDDLANAARVLTAAGLGDVRLWLRRFAEFSEGEKFRARLAKSLGEGNGQPLICDEFGSPVDRRTAQAIGHNLRRLVTRGRHCIVVAAVHEDLAADLQPDVILRLSGGGRWRLEEPPPPVERPVSFLRRLQVAAGHKRDFEPFAAMHYRSTDELGFVDKVFVLRDGPAGDALGIVVYAHGPLELSLRNGATEGRFSRHPGRLKRGLRMLRRLVVRPDVRGCGLGAYLVRRTLPLVGTEYVECLSVMGALHPVFERAGMRRVGVLPASPERKAAAEALAALDVDVQGADFAGQVGRDPRVRRVVIRAVAHWYAATGGGAKRALRQSPAVLARVFRGWLASRPVYYLWRRG